MVINTYTIVTPVTVYDVYRRPIVIYPAAPAYVPGPATLGPASVAGQSRRGLTTHGPPGPQGAGNEEADMAKKLTELVARPTRRRSKFGPARATPAFLLAAVLAGGVAAAQDGSADDGLIDPQAERRLRAVSDYLGSADTLRFQAASFFDEVEDSGVKVKRFIIHDVVVQRPDRLHFRSRFDDDTSRIGWYDGTRFVVASETEGLYIDVEAPETIDELVDMLQQDYGMTLPVADLLYSDFFAAQAPHILSAAYLGERRADDLVLDHLSFESTGADWQLWAEADDTPVPVRMVIEFIHAEGAPQYMITLRDVAIDGPVDDALFQPDLLPEWQLVEPQAQ